LWKVSRWAARRRAETRANHGGVLRLVFVRKNVLPRQSEPI
jgi:hypothetical protein